MTDSDLREAAERAYGCLWSHLGLSPSSVTQARKLLLAALDKDGQRRGIEYAKKIGLLAYQVEQHDAERTP